MNASGQNLIGQGLLMMGNTTSTSSSGAKNLFTTQGWQYLYNMKGNIVSSVWSHYGYGGTDPYKVVIDRDGNIRAKGSVISQVEQVMNECVGL